MPTKTVTVPWDAAFTACACRRFADILANLEQFSSIDDVITAARTIWWNDVGVVGWLEAFAAHPRVGDASALREKYAGKPFGTLSQGEQAATLSSGDEAVFTELAALNKAYEARFGHIFIICASGKSAAEMLAAIKARITTPPYEELATAAREQMKITELRLAKLLAPPPAPAPDTPMSPAERAAVRTGQIATHLTAGGGAPAGLRSPITTHVLDTALGKPAEGLPISLHRLMDGSNDVWDAVALGRTNADGRIPDLLPPAGSVPPGTYRMLFDTGAYLRACAARYPAVFSSVPFYPKAYIDFTIEPSACSQHYHIPLLLSPYSLSTYRGS